jgi:hypothetical protein
MISITKKEADFFRNQLANNPEALSALDRIERHGINLEDKSLVIDNNIGVAAAYFAVPGVANAIPFILGSFNSKEHEFLIRSGLGLARSQTLIVIIEKCRKFICQKEVKDALESGLIAPIIEPLAHKANIPLGTATSICICIFKLSTKELCQVPQSTAEISDDD